MLPCLQHGHTHRCGKCQTIHFKPPNLNVFPHPIEQFKLVPSSKSKGSWVALGNSDRVPSSIKCTSIAALEADLAFWDEETKVCEWGRLDAWGPAGYGRRLEMETGQIWSRKRSIGTTLNCVSASL